MTNKNKELIRKQTLEIGQLYFNNQLEIWQISQKTGLSISTVWRSIQRYRGWVQTSLSPDKIIEETYTENISNKKKLLQIAWEQLQQSENPHTKNQYAKLINDLLTSKIDTLERLRLIPKASNPLTIDIQMVQDELGWERQQTLSQNEKLASQLLLASPVASSSSPPNSTKSDS